MRSNEWFHYFVLHYAKPLQDLEWDKAFIIQTRFRMGSGGYNPSSDCVLKIFNRPGVAGADLKTAS